MNFTASWIWHPTISAANNFYLYARRTFDLADLPADARLHITACCLYKLFINGRLVGRGPNPADATYYFYDTYEVSSFLKPGKNLIAVLAYNYGPKAHGVISQNYGPDGLLAELQAGGSSLLRTDPSWRVIQSPAFAPHTDVNNTLYGDFKEIFDVRQEPAGWNIDPNFDDSSWLAAGVRAKHPIQPSCLLPRQIPFLAGNRLLPRNAFWESASVTASWRDDWEVYREHTLSADHCVPPSTHPDAHKPCRVRKTHADFNPAVFLDFGTLVTGYPEIHVASAKGGTIDVLYGEDPYLVRIDRFILQDGPQVLAPFNRRTFRYLKLLFVDTPDSIEISEVALEERAYPVAAPGTPTRGAFQCSDPLVNQIYQTAVNTIRLSMLDHFCDCPGRERTIYGGDVYNENLHAYYAFGDSLINRKTLRQMFALQYPAGPLPPLGPYLSTDHFYAMWSAYFGLAFLDDYELTADRTFLDELYPRFLKLVDWTLAEIEHEPHLVGSPGRNRPQAATAFESWSTAPKVVFDLRTNGPFFLMLTRAAGLARSLGRVEEADRIAAAAQTMKRGIQKHLLDPATGLARGYRTDGAPEAQYLPNGQAENAYLIWSGMLTQRKAASVAARLRDDADNPPQLKRHETPFFALHHGMALFSADNPRTAPSGLSGLNFLRRYYGDLLRRGATTFWEHFSLDWPIHAQPDRQNSLCHGWSAAPAYLLPAYVLGIRPLAPGFARALVAPQPGDLTSASGSVSTPHGPITVRWERSGRSGGKLSLNSPVPVQVVLPGKRGAQPIDLPAGQHSLP